MRVLCQGRAATGPGRPRRRFHASTRQETGPRHPAAVPVPRHGVASAASCAARLSKSRLLHRRDSWQSDAHGTDRRPGRSGGRGLQAANLPGSIATRRCPVHREGCFSPSPFGFFPLTINAGSVVVPIRNLSTACAAERPSRIAHTTSDWPRRISPAVNTLRYGGLIRVGVGGDALPRWSSATLRDFQHSFMQRMHEAHGEQRPRSAVDLEFRARHVA